MLPGTLTLPEGDGPFPAVVLVHGSGPNDRDETIYENKPFKDLAQNLAQKGIAVYRYDKRTYVYGKDMAADMSLTLDEETVIDAAAAVSLLKNREDIDSDRVFVLGHSLGGQAIPRIHAALASAENRAAGYIFLAAPARNLAEITREQYDFLYSFNPVLTNTQKAQKEEIYAQLDRLDNVSALDDSEVLMGAYAFYWKDLLAYDPVSSASEITEALFRSSGGRRLSGNHGRFQSLAGHLRKQQKLVIPVLYRTYSPVYAWRTGQWQCRLSEKTDGRCPCDRRYRRIYKYTLKYS